MKTIKNLKPILLTFLLPLFALAETPAMVNLTIVNNTQWDFMNVYISSSSSDSWGEDQLGTVVLDAGSTHTFSIQSGTYDIKIIDEDGDECIQGNVSVRGNMSLSFDNNAWLTCSGSIQDNDTEVAESSSSGDVSVTSGENAVRIVNDSRYDIYYVYISAAGAAWGPDRLGSSSILYAGESRTFYLDDGSYDFKLVDEDDDECAVYSININHSQTIEISNTNWISCIRDLNDGPFEDVGSSNGMVSFTLQNATEYDFYYVYISSSDTDSWGEDRLGDAGILYNGQSWTFNLPAGTYDIKVIDEDEDECVTMGVTVTYDRTYVFTNEQYLECAGY